MQDRASLLTEGLNARSADLDRMGIAEAFDVMQAEDASIAAAVARAKPQIVAAIELVADALHRGGRLIYVGAGTSGRLGVLDAVECPPTFLTDPQTVVGLIAGGQSALHRAVEGAEDDADQGGRDTLSLRPGPLDVVFGLTAGGTTPYVRGALQVARAAGARTVFFACVPRDQAPVEADVEIRVLVGPEVIAGSTRLKAGLATKMVLNRVSTLAMVAIGKVYGNLMVDVNARGSAKLHDRAVRIVQNITGLPRNDSIALLDRAGWHAKTAVLMHQTGCTADQAVARLQLHAGRLRRALQEA